MTVRRRRADGGRANGEAGMTLVETLVGMTMASVLLAVIGSVYMSSLNAMGDQRSRTAMTGEARVVMESVARRARVAIRPTGEANAIVLATATSLTVYSSVMTPGSTEEPAPLKAEYYVDKGCLMEARTPARTLASPLPSGQVFAWDTGRRATCLAHLKGDPLFTYYDTAALPAGGEEPEPLGVPTGGLGAAARTSVRSVGLILKVADPTRPTAGGLQVSTRVTLTNLATGALGG